MIPLAASLKLERTYWIVGTKAASKLPKVVTFRDWLLREVAADERRLKKLFPRA